VSTNRRKTALVVGLAVTTLVFASSAWAGAQQSRVIEFKEAPRVLVEIQEAQAIQELEKRVEAEKRAQEQLQRAYAMAQNFDVRPMMRMSAFGMRSGNMAARVLANAEDLALTEEQTKSIRDTQRNHRRNDIRRDADIEIAELELDEMMEADVPDLDTIEAHMRQIADLQVDERMASLRMDRAVRDTLSAEQIEQLDELSPANFVFRTYQRQRNR